MLTLWFAHGCLRFLEVFRGLVRSLKRLEPHLQDKVLRRIEERGLLGPDGDDRGDRAHVAENHRKPSIV
jgi:hypothetical protein